LGGDDGIDAAPVGVIDPETGAPVDQAPVLDPSTGEPMLDSNGEQIGVAVDPETGNFMTNADGEPINAATGEAIVDP